MSKSQRNPMSLGRRRLLQAAALGLGTLGLPPLAIERFARAGGGPNRKAQRLVVVELIGGIRTSATFLASSEKKYNPWGTLPGAGAVPFGAVLAGPNPPPTLGEAWGKVTAPGIEALKARAAILGSWDEKR